MRLFHCFIASSLSQSILYRQRNMKLVCVFLILFSLQCIESAPNCPDGQSWCAGRLQGSCCGHPGTCTTYVFFDKRMFNFGMTGFNFIRILKLSDFLDVSTQVLAIHLMWKMASPDQSLEVTNRPQLKHNFHRFWLFPVIKLYLVVVWYNKERSFEITTSQVVILISNWGSEFQLSF